MKIGDVVWLKSGGPPMTVVGLPNLHPLTVEVNWIKPDELVGSSFFPLEALTTAPLKKMPRKK